MKVLITSGGCKVPIDDVRNIGNFSSGRYGAELANEFLKDKHEVIFFHERGSKLPTFRTFCPEYMFGVMTVPPPKLIEYKDYYGYLTVKDLIKREQPDIIISAAAISDYVLDKTQGKISSDNDELVIRLKKGEKVIKSFRELAPNALIVGFKLLVGAEEDEVNTAVNKVFSSGADIVVYNDLYKLRNGNQTRRIYQRYPKDHPGYSWIRQDEYLNVEDSSELVDKIVQFYNK